MVHLIFKHSVPSALFFALLSAGISCGSAPKKEGAPIPAQTFGSPQEAGDKLLAAADSGNRKELVAIFGPTSTTVLFTGNETTDDTRLRNFASEYKQMHRWRAIKAGAQILLVGIQNVPFPIPLYRNPSGRWTFDTAAGKDEILARRIGKNELTAMQATEALADAERQYFNGGDGGHGRQYAQKIVSDPGWKNGLYWPVAEGQPRSPLGRLGDFAKAAPANDPVEFNGYRYRILSKSETPGGPRDYVVNGKMTGGFAILAYPAEYQSSGIMSFLISENGQLLQKDLGERTANLGAEIAIYNPADGWTPAVI